MKKNRIYIILFSALVTVLILLFIFRNEITSTFNEKDRMFAVEDPGKIGKIFLADRGNTTLTMKRKEDDSWTINDQYPVAERRINLLLQTLSRMQAHTPVAEAAHNNVVREMAGKHTFVEIYDRDENLMKSYFVGSAPPSDIGNYMRMKDAERIFIVRLPNLHGNLTSRFSLDVNDWRDRSIFSYSPGSIKALKIDYLNNDGGFEILIHDDENMEVRPLNPEYELPSERLDKRAVNMYLNYYEWINAEAFANDHESKQAVLAGVPSITIEVTDKNDRVNEVLIYPKPVTRRTKTLFDEDGNEVHVDLDRYFALINNKEDFVIIQDFVFGKLFVPYQFFFFPVGPPEA